MRQGPLPGGREVNGYAAAGGLALVAIAVAHRMAFYSDVGAVLLPLGFFLIGLSMVLPAGGTRAYPALFAVLCVIAALAPFDPTGPNPIEAGLTIGAALAFLTLDVTRTSPWARLLVPAALLVAAHAHYLLRFPHPLHQDVWTFLNGGVEMLLRGENPYRGVRFIEAGVAKVVPYTYPPGALLVLAPFRVLAGDVRWAYVAAEAAVAAMWAVALRQGAAASRWRDALVLVPLALPRTSQAFYIFTNHEWVLVGLVLGALLLAWHARAVPAGILLGLAIASKQYVLVYPLLFLVPVFGRRRLTIALAVALAVTIPFLLWDPSAFLRDTLGNLSQGIQLDRLTLWAMLQRSGMMVPRLFQAAAAGAVLTAGLVAAYSLRADPRRSLIAGGLSLGAFAFASSFAAYNYYAYAVVFITWGLLAPATLFEKPAPEAP